MARNHNYVSILGRLGKDPELKETKNGVPCVDFTLANNRDSGDNERVNWLSCRAYKGTAETICKYLTKGRKILVEGELWEDHWEKDGKYNSRTYVLVTSFEFIDSKGAGESSGGGTGRSRGETFTPKSSGFVDEEYESYDAYDPDEEF